MEDEFLVSYEAVTPGVPVLTRDKEQFGILEHVLEVPQLDLFDGIVVWVGGGAFADREIQKELTKGHPAAARNLERLSPSGGLRFVDADKIAAITAGYIRCDLDQSEVGLLAPAGRGARLSREHAERDRPRAAQPARPDVPPAALDPRVSTPGRSSSARQVLTARR